MNETATVGMIFGLYIALCACMSRERVDHVNDCLLAFSDDPRTPEHEAHLYRLLAESAQDAQDRRQADFCRPDQTIVGGTLH